MKTCVTADMTNVCNGRMEMGVTAGMKTRATVGMKTRATAGMKARVAVLSKRVLQQV